MAFGLRQLRKQPLLFIHWVALAHCLFVCKFWLFLKAMKWEYVSVFVHLSKVPSAVTLASRSAAAESKWKAHPASPQLPKKHFYTQSQEEPDVYTPTHSGTYRHTDTYTLHWGSSRRCVLCNSRVKLSQTPPDLSNWTGCQLRVCVSVREG